MEEYAQRNGPNNNWEFGKCFPAHSNFLKELTLVLFVELEHGFNQAFDAAVSSFHQ